MLKEIAKIIGEEGGLTSDTVDAGGLTKFGISQRAYPLLDIRNLTEEDAAAIYKRDYWDKLNCDSFTYAPFRWKITDIAVNMGVSVAQGFLAAISHPDSAQGTIELMRLQVQKYAWIVKNNPVQIRFLHGWLIRATDLGEDLLP